MNSKIHSPRKLDPFGRIKQIIRLEEDAFNQIRIVCKKYNLKQYQFFEYAANRYLNDQNLKHNIPIVPTPVRVKYKVQTTSFSPETYNKLMDLSYKNSRFLGREIATALMYGLSKIDIDKI